MTMGTRIAVLHGGRLQQQGPPQQLYDEPGNLLVATLVGSPAMNLLRGRIERDGDTLHCVLAEARLPLAVGNGRLRALAAYAGAEVAVGIRAEHLGSPASGPAGRPTLRGRIKFVELLGAERHVQLELDTQPVVVAAAGGAGEDTAEPLPSQASPGRALVIARFEPHAAGDVGDLAEIAVTTERLHFFDLVTGLAIR
jgi:multiple sugar transport system ATP-binding protein